MAKKERLSEIINDIINSEQAKDFDDLADMVGYHPSALNAMVNGQKTIPDNLIGKLYIYFNVNREWLTKGTGDKFKWFEQEDHFMDLSREKIFQIINNFQELFKEEIERSKASIAHSHLITHINEILRVLLLEMYDELKRVSPDSYILEKAKHYIASSRKYLKEFKKYENEL